MTKEELFGEIKKKESFLCVGLDTDPNKIPAHLLKEEDPIFAFNKQIIDATADYCVSYKPNIAFYESLGTKGWDALQKTLEYMPKSHFSIADAKRGDIGNTSDMYAKAFFKNLDFDSITVAPYMGEDSVTPFLYKGKWVIVLAHTSNKGGLDFQRIINKDTGNFLFQDIMIKNQEWATPEQLMFVVGATRAESLLDVRKVAPDNFLLVPGVGAQGGDLQGVAKYGMNKECGLLVNSSRGIIYASNGTDFADVAKKEAQKLQQEMSSLLEKYL
ncbi:orotidine-5'-phosphate decarboxylase [Flammeovirga pectinis]|uniref:Orotidine-5'-phosphate decarboxylase n=1 Tax=Flammeovirga pectinis TaxID=2494373 RepID=A0A3Q9FMF9_9BACT|nr:orotidine-5'-phosphate decarboxylase [Flammeovirga pectinis]AZQ61589.1 orotidine-5'-phosphate decarboxylase [Flammeovirga pectinis]